MAEATLKLSALQALITLGGYGGRGNLAPSSSVLGLSAALFLSDLSIWQGAGYELTGGEIDDIQAMIAQLENDLMVTDDMYPMDRVSVTHSLLQTIPANENYLLPWDTEAYDPEDMHDNSVNNSRLYAVNEGLHIISLNISYVHGNDGAYSWQLFHYDDALSSGTRVRQCERGMNENSLFGNAQITAQLYLAKDDYVYCICQHNSTGTVLLFGSTASPWFSMVRL